MQSRSQFGMLNLPDLRQETTLNISEMLNVQNSRVVSVRGGTAWSEIDR
jgi:hypothetical protein